MSVSGKQLTLIFGGSVLVWSGLKGKKVTGSLRDLIAGKSPAGAPGTPIIGTDPGATMDPGSAGLATGGPVTDSQIANTAVQFVGHCYHYGGSPGTNGQGCWDCSSFVNWVIGKLLEMAIPGFGPGAYTGATHGPNTVIWLAWPGAVHISRAEIAAGDLIIYETHMGIAISNSQMVSAEDAADNTQIAGIDAMTESLGEVMFAKRLRAQKPLFGKVA